jgi:hypothetical protein
VEEMKIYIDSKNTIPYKYYVKKYKRIVYRISKLGNEDWRVDKMPFIEMPFIKLTKPK